MDTQLTAPSDQLDIRTDDDVGRTFVKVFGRPDTPGRGVVHVVAVAVVGGKNQVMRINETTPSSKHDTFALGVVRASVGAIVTTGEILRREPHLRHGFPGDLVTQGALATWRARNIGTLTPPRSLVLTSGRNISLDHPLFHGANEVTLMTSHEAPSALVSDAAKQGIEVVQSDDVDVRYAVDHLLQRHAITTVSIEAGPTTTAALYRTPIRVDEIFLSVFEGELSAAAIAGEFLDGDTLSRNFDSRRGAYRVTTSDGGWAFHRLHRKNRNGV